MKALSIVAHPDDETIWMGSQFSRHKDWQWTIFSLCRANDPDRSPKFLAVCQHYNSKPIITNLEDDKLLPLDLNEIIALIEKYLPEKEFDIIFTHGKNGEYGHIRHKELHQAVNKMIEDSKLKTKKVFYFNYEKKNNHCSAINNKKNYFKLNEEETKEKKCTITERYGFDKGSFEEKSCGDECFTEK